MGSLASDAIVLRCVLRSGLSSEGADVVYCGGGRPGGVGETARRGVAQLGSALVLGTRGRRFKSGRPDWKSVPTEAKRGPRAECSGASANPLANPGVAACSTSTLLEWVRGGRSRTLPAGTVYTQVERDADRAPDLPISRPTLSLWLAALLLGLVLLVTAAAMHACGWRLEWLLAWRGRWGWVDGVVVHGDQGGMRLTTTVPGCQVGPVALELMPSRQEVEKWLADAAEDGDPGHGVTALMLACRLGRSEMRKPDVLLVVPTQAGPMTGAIRR